MNGDWGSDDRCHSALLVFVLWCLYCRCACRLWCLFYGLVIIAKNQWLGMMNELQILIEQMTSDISSQAMQLHDFRLHLFLKCLNARSILVKNITTSDGQTGKQVQVDVEVPCEGNLDQSLKNGLRSWFESLSIPGLLWEFHLLLNEIVCGCDLDSPRLILI